MRVPGRIVHENDRRECGSRGSRRAGASLGAQTPSAVSDAVAMRSAGCGAVPGCFGLVGRPAVFDCSGPASAGARVVVECVDLVHVAGRVAVEHAALPEHAAVADRAAPVDLRAVAVDADRTAAADHVVPA
jgi:hypothetical protein